MSDAIDLLIVGAGPAGMTAAIRARALGLAVTVVDDQPAPGGQIWRGVEAVAASDDGRRLGAEYVAGGAVATEFRGCGATYEPGMQVWQIEPGFRVFVSRDGAARMLTARAVLLATGAQERPVPFPGWTLPGVLTVGAAQILLKTANQVPADPVWIAGGGPLALLYATQLLRAGGRIAGILDTTPRRNARAALPHLPQALLSLSELSKGLAWRRDLRRSGVRIVRHVSRFEAIGTDRVEAIRFTAPGGDGELPASVILVHEGVVPTVHPTMALGCAHDWHDGQLCWVPRVDAWGETSVAGIFVAGDGAGIGGAQAALHRGDIAALGIARRLGRLDETRSDWAATAPRRKLARALATRPFLDALFRPRPEHFAPTDATIVCRCEALTAGALRKAAAVGTPGPNQVKAFTRAGMGPCQGRQCGYTVAHILADAQGRTVEEVGFYRIRPPLKPVTLGELAALDVPEPA